MRRRDPLATHNERVKLSANSLNAIGLGFVAYALLRPLVDGTAQLDAGFLVWPVTGLAMHLAARYILRYLEVEDRP